MTNLWRY